MMRQKRRIYQVEDQQAGFTIIELLIATTVFSMVLMVVLYGVLSFSHAYYSGVNASATQSTARTIVNDVSQSIEFSGDEIDGSTLLASPPAPNTYTFCTGGATYYYILGQKYDGTQSISATNPGLYMEPAANCTTAPNFADVNGKELLSSGMRITFLNVAKTSNARLYLVQLGLAYGGSDLLCNFDLGSAPHGCAVGATPYGQDPTRVQGADPNDVVCKQVTGSQFCAHAGLSTTVSLRVGTSQLAPEP